MDTKGFLLFGMVHAWVWRVVARMFSVHRTYESVDASFPTPMQLLVRDAVSDVSKDNLTMRDGLPPVEPT